MTLHLFKQWLHSFEAKMGVKNCKVVLFIDCCTAHPNVKLNNVELFFYQQNPHDLGFFNLLKHKFHSVLINAVMRKLAAGKTFYKWMCVMPLEHFVSWEKIAPEVRAACFRQAGFRKNNLIKVVPPHHGNTHHQVNEVLQCTRTNCLGDHYQTIRCSVHF
ncbi:hypothetical protein PR048_000375 [Dryococelus australis]|uniref:DDE-1 domain-containing protein n=1 Tax=Dryococelus australis TaxID=614101 RepID=A0ABQ9IEF3_9NEOP|nr:hypothetical protein PR048_000375 [Dryococelus australis]